MYGLVPPPKPPPEPETAPQPPLTPGTPQTPRLPTFAPTPPALPHWTSPLDQSFITDQAPPSPPSAAEVEVQLSKLDVELELASEWEELRGLQKRMLALLARLQQTNQVWESQWLRLRDLYLDREIECLHARKEAEELKLRVLEAEGSLRIFRELHPEYVAAMDANRNHESDAPNEQ